MSAIVTLVESGSNFAQGDIGAAELTSASAETITTMLNLLP